MTKTVLITGVSGFIGRSLANKFSDIGWQVIGIGANSRENAPQRDLAKYFQLRLPHESLKEIIASTKPNLCIHGAGKTSVPASAADPLADFCAGPALTIDILDTLRLRAPDCRFIMLSSAAVYGCPSTLPICETMTPAPISPYGYHKWQCELLCREFHEVFGMQTSCARIFSAYGAGLRRQVLWDLSHQAITKKAIIGQGSGNESRDFIHVKDVAQSLVMIAERANMNGEVYNIASGEETRICDVATMVTRALDEKIDITFNGELPTGTPLNWRADISRIKAIGFEPSVSIQAGIASYTHWCLAELGRVAGE